MTTINEYSPDFERFWQKWPLKRRQGKGAAYKSFQKVATNRERIERIIAAVDEQIANHMLPSRNNWEYTPMPATWLNQGRFDDSAPAEPAAPVDGPPASGGAYKAAVKKYPPFASCDSAPLIEDAVSVTSFDVWFAPLRIVEDLPNSTILCVPNKGHRGWLVDEYLDRLNTAFGHPVTLVTAEELAANGKL